MEFMKVDVKSYLETGILVQQTDGILTFLDERIFRFSAPYCCDFLNNVYS